MFRVGRGSFHWDSSPADPLRARSSESATTSLMESSPHHHSDEAVEPERDARVQADTPDRSTPSRCPNCRTLSSGMRSTFSNTIACTSARWMRRLPPPSSTLLTTRS